MDIFISHSSKDKDLAEALTELLRLALNVTSDKIRCTSVDGTRLELGADTNEVIKTELRESRVFIVLLTPASLESDYVLFEMGARWGAKLHLGPLMAKGATSRDIPSPIGNLNALQATEEGQLHQFLGDVAQALNLERPSPSSYLKAFKNMMSVSSTVSRVVEPKRGSDTDDASRRAGQDSDERTSGSAYAGGGSVDMSDGSVQVRGGGARASGGSVHVHGGGAHVSGAGAFAGGGSVRQLARQLAADQLAARPAARIPKEQEAILSVLWGGGSFSAGGIATRASLSGPLVEYHIGELQKRGFVHIPMVVNGAGSVLISHEGRHYLVSNGLVS